MLASCVKPEEKEDVNYDFTIWVLNEGLWNMNNSSITAYNSTTQKLCADVFKQENSRCLGDIANDIIIYGSKAYIAVNMSGVIEVVDVFSGKSIRQISLLNDKGENRQPRCLTYYKNKVYGCCFDGSVVRIDTSSLKIDGIVQAGQNPDGMCVTNNKLYVSNSGGLNFPDYGNTVSVFNLTSFTEIKRIRVSTNPTILKADKQGDVYVMCRGNYSDIPSCLQRIDSKNDTLVQTITYNVSNFDIYDDLLYFYYYDDASKSVNFQVLNNKTETIINTSFLKDKVSIQTPYGINVNPNDGSVFISDALDYQTTGDVYCFDKNGKLSYQFEGGLCPKKTVFLK